MSPVPARDRVRAPAPRMGDDGAMSQTPHEDPTVAPPGSVDQPLDPAGSTEPTAPATPTHRGQDPDPLRSSRASGFYAAIVALGVVLVLLVIFIVQNTERQDVKFLWLEG